MPKYTHLGFVSWGQKFCASYCHRKMAELGRWGPAPELTHGAEYLKCSALGSDHQLAIWLLAFQNILCSVIIIVILTALTVYQAFTGICALCLLTCRFSHLSPQPHTHLKLRKLGPRKGSDVLTVTHRDDRNKGTWTQACVDPLLRWGGEVQP